MRRVGTGVEVPSVLGLIDLEEGIGRLVATVVADGSPTEIERRLEIGMPVRVAYLGPGSGTALYCLRLD